MVKSKKSTKSLHPIVWSDSAKRLFKRTVPRDCLKVQCQEIVLRDGVTNFYQGTMSGYFTK